MKDTQKINDQSNASGTMSNVHVPAFDLPTSYFLSDETTQALAHSTLTLGDYEAHIGRWMTSLDSTPVAEIPAIRQREVELFHQSQAYTNLTNAYKVIVDNQVIAGIPVERFTPLAGISRKNQNRILINLHGGCFTFGSRTTSKLESYPIASVGGSEC